MGASLSVIGPIRLLFLWNVCLDDIWVIHYLAFETELTSSSEHHFEFVINSIRYTQLDTWCFWREGKHVHTVPFGTKTTKMSWWYCKLLVMWAQLWKLCSRGTTEGMEERRVSAGGTSKAFKRVWSVLSPTPSLWAAFPLVWARSRQQDRRNWYMTTWQPLYWWNFSTQPYVCNNKITSYPWDLLRIFIWLKRGRNHLYLPPIPCVWDLAISIQLLVYCDFTYSKGTSWKCTLFTSKRWAITKYLPPHAKVYDYISKRACTCVIQFQVVAKVSNTYFNLASACKVDWTVGFWQLAGKCNTCNGFKVAASDSPCCANSM